MANRKSSINSLLKRLGNSTSSTSGGTSSTDLVNGAQTGSLTEKSAKALSSGDMRSLSIGATSKVTGISFGKPSSIGSTTSSTGSEWSNLLKQAASGGIASALGGGLANIGGIGTLVSGIVSLFGGGKSAPPPLVEFHLPASQQTTVYSSASGRSVLSGDAVEPAQPKRASAGTYAPASTASNSLQYSSADIAQAVKTALLNSSSLNDVIAEI